jgi:hypothetical protein
MAPAAYPPMPPYPPFPPYIVIGGSGPGGGCGCGCHAHGSSYGAGPQIEAPVSPPGFAAPPYTTAPPSQLPVPSQPLPNPTPAPISGIGPNRPPDFPLMAVSVANTPASYPQPSSLTNVDALLDLGQSAADSVQALMPQDRHTVGT